MQHVLPPISLQVQRTKAGSILLKAAILKHLFMQVWPNKQKTMSHFLKLLYKK